MLAGQPFGACAFATFDGFHDRLVLSLGEVGGTASVGEFGLAEHQGSRRGKRQANDVPDVFDEHGITRQLPDLAVEVIVDLDVVHEIRRASLAASVQVGQEPTCSGARAARDSRRSAARRAAAPSRMPRSSIALQISSTVKGGRGSRRADSSSSSPSWASRLRAWRTGVRDTPKAARTKLSSVSRAPAGNVPCSSSSRRPA